MPEIPVLHTIKCKTFSTQFQPINFRTTRHEDHDLTLCKSFPVTVSKTIICMFRYTEKKAVKWIEGLRERTEYVPQLWTEKITHKASDTAENLQLYWVVRFFHPRSLCTTTHLMLFSERPPIYASCMTIPGGRTEQHVRIYFGQLAAVD